MDPLDYYSEQSPFTDPGAQKHLLDDLPGSVAGLTRVVQGLVVHYRERDFGHVVPEERMPEIDTRYADRMLARIVELDDGPLTEGRPPEKRLVGCCRDFTVLFLTMARHLGIPGRARVGFSTYFGRDFYFDHEVAEVWQEGRWRLVDAQMDEGRIGLNGIPFDVLDVPRDRFLVGGSAWRMCRDGVADPTSFGVDPEMEIRGQWFVRQKLVQDLAALNKSEAILWDAWGLMEGELSEDEASLLDKVADLTTRADDSLLPELLRTYGETPRLRVSPTVTSYSPAAETPLKVRLPA